MTGAMLGSSVIGAIGSNRAASAQADAAGQMADVQRYIFDQNTEMTAPWRETGVNALNVLSNQLLGPVGGTAGTSGTSGTPGTAANGEPRVYSSDVQDQIAQFQRLPQAQQDRIRERMEGMSPGGYTRAGIASGLDPATMSDPQTMAGFGEYLEHGMGTTGANGADGTAGTEGGRYGSFRETPGYRFRFDQGVNAIDSSAASRGNLFSGATGEALTDFGQNIGSAEYNNWLAGVGGLAGYGQSAVGQQMGAGQNYAQGMTNALSNLGNANAAGAMGMANAFQGGLNNWMGWQAFQGAA